MENNINTNPLMDKVDKMRAVSFIQNAHNLTPPSRMSDSQGNEVAIVEALKAERYIVKIILELKGYFYDPLKKGYVQYRRPVMNELGIGNFIQCIENIMETIEFSYFKEENIPAYATHLYESNYPYYTVYCSDYDLSREDFNLISTILLNAIVTSLNKAKGGGHRNVVRGTYSEDLLGKVVSNNEQMQRQSGGGFFAGLARLNPLRRQR